MSQQHLLTKFYFPRLFILTASIGARLVDMAISAGIYALVLAWYRVFPSWQIVFLTALVLLTIMAVLGMGYLLSAVTASYCDFRFVIPFMLQTMMFVSPVAYSVNLVPAKYQWLLALSPIAGIIDGFRSAILGGPWDLFALSACAAMAVGLIVVGLCDFRRAERQYADIA